MNNQSKKILIVEDDLIISMVLERMVERMNHTAIASVGSGREAIEAAEKYSPDLILMDIHLNDEINGIEVMNRIRRKSPMPVIYITGNSDAHSLKRAKETNFIEYMAKPIQMSELEDAVKKAFQ